MKTWYLPGRKESRGHIGIIRHEDDFRRVVGVRSVFSPNVLRHCGKLRRDVSLDGLWAWAETAKAMHLGGIPVHSGTIPVERLWSILSSFLPAASRCITHKWFEFISELAFLRYNYLHFHKGDLATWTKGDALLAQKIELLSDLGVNLLEELVLEHCE